MTKQGQEKHYLVTVLKIYYKIIFYCYFHMIENGTFYFPLVYCPL